MHCFFVVADFDAEVVVYGLVDTLNPVDRTIVSFLAMLLDEAHCEYIEEALIRLGHTRHARYSANQLRLCTARAASAISKDMMTSRSYEPSMIRPVPRSICYCAQHARCLDSQPVPGSSQSGTPGRRNTAICIVNGDAAAQQYVVSALRRGHACDEHAC